MHSCKTSKDGKYCPSAGKAVSTHAYFTAFLALFFLPLKKLWRKEKLQASNTEAWAHFSSHANEQLMTFLGKILYWGNLFNYSICTPSVPEINNAPRLPLLQVPNLVQTPKCFRRWGHLKELHAGWCCVRPASPWLTCHAQAETASSEHLFPPAKRKELESVDC